MEHMLELCSVDPDWRPLVLDHLHRELYPPVKTMHSRLITARKLVLGLLPAAEQGAVDSAWPAVTGPMLFRYIEDLAGMSPLRRWLLDVVEALDGYPCEGWAGQPAAPSLRVGLLQGALGVGQPHSHIIIARMADLPCF